MLPDDHILIEEHPGEGVTGRDVGPHGSPIPGVTAAWLLHGLDHPHQFWQLALSTLVLGLSGSFRTILGWKGHGNLAGTQLGCPASCSLRWACYGCRWRDTCLTLWEGMLANAVGPSKPYIWLCMNGLATHSMASKMATYWPCEISSMATSTSWNYHTSSSSLAGEPDAT